MIRTILRRMLISWWMIPVSFIGAVFFEYLIAGDIKKVLKEYKEFAKWVWG